MTACKFDEAWRGKCGKETVEGDYCATHAAMKCCVCKEQATHDCAHTGQFVCGAPLCDSCEGHTDTSKPGGSWGFMNHSHRAMRAMEPARMPQGLSLEQHTETINKELLRCLIDCVEDSEECLLRHLESYGETYKSQRVAAMRKCIADARAAIDAATAKQISESLGTEIFQDPEGTKPVTAAAEAIKDTKDAALLDWLKENTCDLRCVTTSEDDYDWVVIEHHEAKPHEREIGRAYSYDPRDAIRAARAQQERK